MDLRMNRTMDRTSAPGANRACVLRRVLGLARVWRRMERSSRIAITLKNIYRIHHAHTVFIYMRLQSGFVSEVGNIFHPWIVERSPLLSPFYFTKEVSVGSVLGEAVSVLQPFPWNNSAILPWLGPPSGHITWEHAETMCLPRSPKTIF